MSLIKRLSLHNFRNITSANLKFSSGLNLIYGDNATGKTAIIEALWLLSTGRSFRTSSCKHLIQHEQDNFTLFCEVEYNANSYKLGVQRSVNNTLLKLNNEICNSQIHLAQHLPLQLLTPESHKILEEGPKARRKFMDWGCFYQESTFVPLWRNYQKVLKQRNQSLKQRLSKEQTTIWDKQLVEFSLQISQIRQDYLNELLPHIKYFCQQLMPELTSEIQQHYKFGWPINTQNLYNLMQDNFEKDSKLGHTQYGCHRADISFRFGTQEAIQVLSRGQQKLFVCALLLSQSRLHQTKTNSNVIMLIDDLPSELDLRHRKTLLDILQVLKIQHIVTTTEAHLVHNLNPSTSSGWEINSGVLKDV